MVSIEVGHFSATFDPDLVFAKLGQIVQAGDIESEFTAFREFADHQTSGE